MNKNDLEWAKLFKEHNILEKIARNGSFEITAQQINKYRESRLMTKFDHYVNLPDLFLDNDLSILPITRGSYLIGQFKAYHTISYNNKIKNKIVPFPGNIESIDFANIYSESAALNCAFATGILKDFAGEDLIPTVSGRMSTSIFDFFINGNSQNFKVTVKNSQCEIDGGYESDNLLLLIEAKNYTVTDFLVRQLFYPYRLWQGKITKKVIPVFLTFSNDIFSFFRFEFEDVNKYNSITLIEQSNYIITSETITVKSIQQVLQEVKIIPDDPDIPFPQADSFDRVVDLLCLLYAAENGALNNDFITSVKLIII
jgi:hypothetical protein